MTTTKYSTIMDVQRTTISSTTATTTTEMVTITPVLPTTTIVFTGTVTVSPTCIPIRLNTNGQYCPTTIIMTAYPSCTQATKLTQTNQGGVSKPMHVIISEMSVNSSTQLVPTIALGILTGLFFIVLIAVTIGWVWTCWTTKKRGGINFSNNK